MKIMKILNFFFLLLLTVAAVQAQTFTNPTAITVGAGAANNANPYPSTIAVTGVTQPISNVSVTLNNFSHTFPADLGVVLVGPTGRAFLLQDAAGDAPITNVTYTLSDTGATLLPETSWPPGTYKPANYFAGDSFPAPGPGTAYFNPGPDLLPGESAATFASVFGGTNANGNWNLYVRDFSAGDGGQYAGGWTLNITAGATAAGVTVSGRVLANPKTGSRTPVGVARATVVLTDQSGQTMSAKTDASGYYKFEDVAAGETYVFSVTSTRYQFNSQVVTINEDLDGLNFYGR